MREDPERTDGPGVSRPRVRVDMHLHTAASFDCLSPPDAVARGAFDRGVDRVCITDHDEVHAALELRARYGERVIVGEEVKTRERYDIIGLFLSERVPGGLPVEETCDRIRAQGGLVYVPHPFDRRPARARRILDRLEERIHIVEGFNARASARANQRAIDWAAERGLPLGAGSDAHTLGEVGRATVTVPAFEDSPAAFLAALADASVEGRRSWWTVRLASTYAKLRKRIGAGRAAPRA